MNGLQVGIYARVSSEHQAEAHTIDSQVAALRARVQAEGMELPAEQEFLDAGYSGATLVRPGLERLRDSVASGALDRIYVHSPDRLARKYAYQVMLVDEFQRAGVEIVFLNQAVGSSPEDELLLQVQGMVAEYERAKMMERSRRGKRHAAQTGRVSVLSGAPFGYRFVTTDEGGGEARYEIIAEEAAVVRQVYQWVGQERVTLNEVCRRLQQEGVATRTGKAVWDRTSVWGMLKNPAYMGQAAFGKTLRIPLQPRLRAQRGRSLQPRRAQSVQDQPREKWLHIPVPALVDEALYETVQEQLGENRRTARQRRRGARYLLQGLLVCAACGYSFYGKPVSSSAAKGKVRHYAYYRCIGSDAYRFGGQRVCHNHQVRTDQLEAAVWRQVGQLLEDPQRLEQEYRRRWEQGNSQADQQVVAAQLTKLRQGISRMIDGYAEGLLEKVEFEPRITRLKERVARLERQAKELAAAATCHSELRLIIGRLEDFAAKVSAGIEQADWETKRDLIRTLVKRVEIDHEQVKIVFRIDSGPFGSPAEKKSLQDCRKRERAALGCSGLGGVENGLVKDSTGEPFPQDGGFHRNVSFQPAMRNFVKTRENIAFQNPFR